MPPWWETTPTQAGNDAGKIPQCSSHGPCVPALPADICRAPWAACALPSLQPLCSHPPSISQQDQYSTLVRMHLWWCKAAPHHRLSQEQQQPLRTRLFPEITALTLMRSLFRKQHEKLDQMCFSPWEMHCYLSFTGWQCKELHATLPLHFPSPLGWMACFPCSFHHNQSLFLTHWLSLCLFGDLKC